MVIKIWSSKHKCTITPRSNRKLWRRDCYLSRDEAGAARSDQYKRRQISSTSPPRYLARLLHRLVSWLALPTIN
ncbi:hypothetical protein [Nostoc sp. PCC 9305]|uniref:hypothetical protein n=1 Tax=Nostoc sp. PCC 9305 TaxID=296636 RepID=UPI0039C73FCE